MLKIVVPEKELWDPVNKEFFSFTGQALQMEHSLVSLSKWEAIWKKPFLKNEPKTSIEMISYYKCMTLTQHAKAEAYMCLTPKNIKKIQEYIEDPMTATTITHKDGKGKLNGEQITAELIYYWMIALNIPMECQKWHLNRLITLIEVCNIKNSPGKKMSRRDILTRNAALNAKRKARMHTRG